MAYQERLVKTFEYIAKNLKATHTVMAIATVKGICRPTFTMMDKTEKPETKKYTALREGITEAVAIPVYFICGELAGFGAKVLRNVQDSVNIKKAKKLAEKTGDIIDIEKIKQSPEMTKKIANNLRFLGVCVAALLVIPSVCSVAIKPIVDEIIKPPKTPDTPKSPETLSKPAANTLQQLQPIKRPSINSFLGSHGMKVGGV